MLIKIETLVRLRNETFEHLQALIDFYRSEDPVYYANTILGLQEALDVVTDKFDKYI